jgi:Lysophospholipase
MPNKFKPVRKFLVAAAVLASISVPLAANAAAEFQSETEIGKKLNLPIVKWEDPTRTANAIIVAVHGITLYSETLDRPARHMAEQGYPVYAMDLRGFGKWVDHPEKYGGDSEISFSQSKADLIKTLTNLRSLHPHTPIFMVGESFGANMGISLASSDPHLIDGVIGTAPCYKAWFHPKWRWIPDTVKGAMKPSRQMKLEPYVKTTLAADPEVIKAYLADPRITHYLSPKRLVKTQLENRKGWKEVSKIPKSMPIMLIAGKEDLLYKAKSLQKKVKEMGSDNATLHILPGQGHLLLECQRELDPRVLTLLDNWLSTQSSRAIATKGYDASEAVLTTHGAILPKETDSAALVE